MSFNKNQNEKTIKALQDEGVAISVDKVSEFAFSDSITYKDIARYLVERGYARNIVDAYKYYIGQGTKAYFPSFMLSVEDCLKLIKDSCGISSLAHPNTLTKETNFDDLIIYLKHHGLDCIETHNTKSMNIQGNDLEIIADKYHLIKTVGSDFHNNTTDMLGVDVKDNYLDDFNERIQ